MSTLGKFGGIPTKAMTAKYGGGTSAGLEVVYKEPTFPVIKIKNVIKSKEDININIKKVEEE